jgi:RNA polymerase sigma-70 factor, ECF subfamily
MYRNERESEHLCTRTDHFLIERACTGDGSAFETLVQRYQGKLLCFAQTHVGSEQAYDIVQFVWLQLYRSLPVLQSSPTLSGKDLALKHWLLKVAWNRCVDEMRWCKSHPQLSFSQLEEMGEENGTSMLLAFQDTAPIPEECAIQQDERESLRKAIELLPPLPRVIVWLRYSEAISFIEIARRLHISPASAKMHYYRACMKLRALFEKHSASSIEQYQTGARWKHPTKAS